MLADPDAIGLPDYAEGNPEGYLFPSTYGFGPNETPEDMLTAMVDRWRQAADEADLEARAEALGYTPHELMTVASLVESEAGRAEDRAKVARVIYNRLENPGTAGTTGKLQIDATVNYAADNELGAVPTTEDLQLDSPYNTYLHEGLPPGPIEAPGDAAIAAAAHPADGDWYYYVTVNLKTGETKFATTYDEFLAYKDELRAVLRDRVRRGLLTCDTGARSWATPSPTRCRRCCTVRRTTRWASPTGSTTRTGCRPGDWRGSSRGSVTPSTAGAASR